MLNWRIQAQLKRMSYGQPADDESLPGEQTGTWKGERELGIKDGLWARILKELDRI